MTAGTIMHRSHLPLKTWLMAVHIVTSHSNGISALQLQAQLGLGSYKSAWLLLHKLRRAMVDPDRSLLEDLVEIDEATLPFRTVKDPTTGGQGRSRQGKMRIAGAVELSPEGEPRRIRLAPIGDFSARSLHAFVAGTSAPGARVITDGWSGYPGLPDHDHQPKVVGATPAHLVQVAREMGLARFGKLSVDGTKVRANASKRKAMSYERMGKEAARLQAEIEALLTKAGMVDAEEDERWGEDFRGDELPEELQRREKRLAAIQAAKARLEAAQRGRDDERGREPGQDRNPRGGRPYKRAYGEPEPKAQSNFTDPESQIMKTSSEGFQQCYNAQMAVDGEHQIIVATQVGPQASDQGQLVGMLDEINETFGVEPAVVLADAGYCNEPDLLELEDRGIDAHVALGREGKSQVAVDPARLPATHRMGEKLASPAGKARYAQRKWLSEAPNGWIKEVLGFRRFSLRGLAKVRGEWDLVCLALNIKRMGTVATC